MSKYKLETKEWNLVELGVIYYVQCCDCGLIHEYVYKKEKGKIYLHTKRNNRATGQIRRYLK